MKERDLKIVFGGDKHEVDVETLIGSLMHTTNVVQEVNRHLQTGKRIDMKIKALERGSFQVHIELVERVIESLFSADRANYVASIITIVSGLYGFARFLGGRKPKDVKHMDDGSVEVTNTKGVSVSVDVRVFDVYSGNKTVRSSIAKQFAGLECNGDVESFVVEGAGNRVQVPNEEFGDVAVMIDDLDDDSREPITEVLEDRYILIVRPSFTRDLKWDFIFEGQKISAKVDDEEIIKRVDDGEQFSKGDYMLADLEVTKFYEPEYDVHVITKDSYRVLRYKDHVKRERQSRLF